MSDGKKDDLIAEIGNVTKELKDLRTELKSFYIDRERHYQDHQFLKELREWVGNIKSTTLRTLITAIVVAVVGLIAGGFILWSKKNIGH